MMTGRTNGRRPERFLKKRRSSIRTFSLISPGSVRSSTLACSTNLADDTRAVGEQFLAVLHDEAARDDVGHALERARLLVDGDHGDDQAVLGEMTPIAQDLVGHLARQRAVDQHASDRRLSGDAGARRRRRAGCRHSPRAEPPASARAPRTRGRAMRACWESCRYSP